MTRFGEIRAGERGAALIVVLAMLLLLSALATLGLGRLRAATDQVVDAETRSTAGFAAEAGARAAQAMAIRKKAAAVHDPNALARPVYFSEAGADIRLQFTDAGVCFNLNSLGRRPGTEKADASPEEFARLLQAAGVDADGARNIAAATAARLSAAGLLWADASEWTQVPGVTAGIWQRAGPLLCALPTREAASFNLNALRPGHEPILVAMGMTLGDARAAILSRPLDGWENARDFWASVGGDSAPSTPAATVAGISSRWLAVRILALTPGGTAERHLLLDSTRAPAQIAASVWLPPQPRDTIVALMQEEQA